MADSNVDALDYLEHPEKHPARPFTVVFGDEPFLKRLVLAGLRQQVLGDLDAEFSLTRFDGRTAELRAVLDELHTVALFGGGRRLVLVEDADDFVTRYRQPLEDHAAAARSANVLVLEVTQWPKTTRLYKAVASSGLGLECKAPDRRKLLKWLAAWGQQRHDVKLEPAAVEVLLELVGPELGLLDQELAKLAVSVEPGQSVSASLVQELVGTWRAKTAWEMIDAAVAGNAPEALAQLDRLLLAGENPIAVLAQIAATLRRFAAATRLIEQAEAAGRRPSVRQALEEAGVKPFVLSKAEQQLRQLGRQRGGQLYDWLLETDLALKGASALAPRTVLERLIARIAAAPQPANSR